MKPNHFQRNTLQRQVILEELRKHRDHPTASQLYEVVRKRLPKISLGTVYRNLDLLSQIGMVQRLEYAGTEARFDGVIDHHYHIRCTRCGKIDDIHDFPANVVKEDVGRIAGYQILGHRLEYLGICPACQD